MCTNDIFLSILRCTRINSDFEEANSDFDSITVLYSILYSVVVVVKLFGN